MSVEISSSVREAMKTAESCFPCVGVGVCDNDYDNDDDDFMLLFFF